MNTGALEKISAASKKNTLTFFVGAGISKLSGMPKWSELIDEICDELLIARQCSYCNEELLAIPQKFFYHLNCDEDKYFDYLSPKLVNNTVKPNIAHALMMSLNPHSYITTNFDNLLELAAIQNCSLYKVVATNDDVSGINGDKFILKAHGDIDHKNIVFKEEDFLNYSDNFKLIETLLKSIFSTNTVVFIGYGLNDYNIKLILNWTKNLLNKSFIEPIFIYADENKLTNIDLRYQKSKGLNLIDIHDFYDSSIDIGSVSYEDRYSIILKKVVSVDALDANEEFDKYQNFEVLYKLLEPLDEFYALRFQDINKKLYPFCRVDDLGRISNNNDVNIFEYFLEMNQTKIIPNMYSKKYAIICSIFSKARIYGYASKGKDVQFDLDQLDFADQRCILFDYIGMKKYINKSHSDIKSIYKKAYYCAKISKFDNAYELFKKIEKTAFEDKNYLLFYLAKVNIISIYRIMKSINRNHMYAESFKICELDELSLDNIEDGQIYRNLPIEFKSKYSQFADICSNTFLYKNAYYSFLETKKVKQGIENNAVEMGITSSATVISRINNNLNFLLKNGILIDDFSEFKISIREQMESVLYQHSVFDKERIGNHFDFGLKRHDIQFDENDFYCFVEYVNDNDIDEMFAKYQIKFLNFINIDKIEIAITNLFKYYCELCTSTSNAKSIEIYPYQHKLLCCLKMIRYIDISIKTIEYITKIILMYEFREIDISEKIYFLDGQIYKNKKYSIRLREIILSKLLDYIGQEQKCAQNNMKFVIHSRKCGMSYYSLANYLSSEGGGKSNKLSSKVASIISDVPQFPLLLLTEYYSNITKKTQKKLVEAIRVQIRNEFSLELFLFLISNNVHLLKDEMNIVKQNINISIEKASKISTTGVISFPKVEPYELLINVGLFCFYKILKNKDFTEYLGITLEFDFLLNPNEFDYDNFDLAWLFVLEKFSHEEFASNPVVKMGIQNSILRQLKSDNLETNDKNELIKLLKLYYI